MGHWSHHYRALLRLQSKFIQFSWCPASPAITFRDVSGVVAADGTVVATALVVMAIMVVLRSNRKETKFEKRKTSHVTEILQVDMVDRRLRSTSLDHSVEMDEMMISNSNIRADDVLKPVSQIVTKIE